jgi:hypothetical protein
VFERIRLFFDDDYFLDAQPVNSNSRGICGGLETATEEIARIGADWRGLKKYLRTNFLALPQTRRIQ